MYHIKVIQVNLTQKLSSILPDIVEEVTLAWKDNTNIGDEWGEINVWDVMLKVVSRTANRMFVGLPLCRNQEFLDNLVEYATEVIKAGTIIDMTPQAFRWSALPPRAFIHRTGLTFSLYQVCLVVHFEYAGDTQKINGVSWPNI